MSKPRPTVIYVDPFPGGHHPDYLAFFIATCHDAGLGIDAYVPSSVWKAASSLVPTQLGDGRHVRQADLEGADTFVKLRFLSEVDAAARQAGASIVFFAMLDPFVPAMAVRRLLGRKFSRPWTGIFFRDSFNYPADEPRFGRNWLKSTTKLMLLRIVLSEPGAQIFTLNPNWRMPTRGQVEWLPDAMTSLDRMAEVAIRNSGTWPVPQSPDKQNGKARFLIYGALAPRKGFIQLCDALLKLDAVTLNKIELRALGRVMGPEPYQQALRERLATLAQRGADVDLTDAYVSETELDAALQWSDVVLAPYLDHIGSSGVMNVAAKYGRQLLAQETYLIGEVVREYDLGATVSSVDTAALANAIAEIVDKGARTSAGAARHRDAHNTARPRILIQNTFQRLLANCAD